VLFFPSQSFSHFRHGNASSPLSPLPPEMRGLQLRPRAGLFFPLPLVTKKSRPTAFFSPIVRARDAEGVARNVAPLSFTHARDTDSDSCIPSSARAESID